MTEQRLWTPTFVIGIIINLFMSSVFYLLMTTMAVYAVERFAASDSGAGLASSGFIIGAVVGRVLAGKFLDVVGRR
ncbi:MAG TPA: MFS transporter, partial [Brevibacterium sp.]|nr:MFS transporter [Brevibacterium sp.]